MHIIKGSIFQIQVLSINPKELILRLPQNHCNFQCDLPQEAEQLSAPSLAVDLLGEAVVSSRNETAGVGGGTFGGVPLKP